MASLTHNDTRPRVGLPSLPRLIAGWSEARAARREQRRIAGELSSYSDRELAELGLFRHDIWAIANGTHRR